MSRSPSDSPACTTSAVAGAERLADPAGGRATRADRRLRGRRLRPCQRAARGRAHDHRARARPTPSPRSARPGPHGSRSCDRHRHPLHGAPPRRLARRAARGHRPGGDVHARREGGDPRPLGRRDRPRGGPRSPHGAERPPAPGVRRDPDRPADAPGGQTPQGSDPLEGRARSSPLRASSRVRPSCSSGRGGRSSGLAGARFSRARVRPSRGSRSGSWRL